VFCRGSKTSASTLLRLNKAVYFSDIREYPKSAINLGREWGSQQVTLEGLEHVGVSMCSPAMKSNVKSQSNYTTLNLIPCET